MSSSSALSLPTQSAPLSTPPTSSDIEKWLNILYAGCDLTCSSKGYGLQEISSVFQLFLQVKQDLEKHLANEKFDKSSTSQKLSKIFEFLDKGSKNGAFNMTASVNIFTAYTNLSNLCS